MTNTDEDYTYDVADDDSIYATILMDELQTLIEDSKMLACLMTGGVTSWEWFEDCLQTFKKETEDGIAFFSQSPE